VDEGDRARRWVRLWALLSREAGGKSVTGPRCACGQTKPAADPTDVRVLLVDDNAWVRSALSALLSAENDVTVVGECEDGSQVVAAAARLQPDVVLMDLAMPVMDGLAATAALQDARSDARVVVLTAEGPGAAYRAAAAGAHALVPKDAPPDALLHCLRTVVGNCACCPHCL
jgi:DNA-binding NarL/FixJ family response regulator